MFFGVSKGKENGDFIEEPPNCRVISMDDLFLFWGGARRYQREEKKRERREPELPKVAGEGEAGRMSRLWEVYRKQLSGDT